MIAWCAGQPLPTQIGLAILAAALLAGLVILAIFGVRKFIKLGHQEDLEAKDRVGLQIEFIKTTAQILGGLFFLVTIYVAWANLVVSQEKHKTDLFTKAIEQLGSDKLEVRLGGIYALERIARDSEKDHGPIMEVLTAFVRLHAPAPTEKPAETKKQPAAAGQSVPGEKKPATEPAPEVKPRADIQAILTVLGRRARIYKKVGDQGLDLRRTDLRLADLQKAHLEGANLQEAHLEGADLRFAPMEGAYLEKARLEGADLKGAHLEGAGLEEARLEGADLYAAHLEGAYLKKACLEGANLMSAHLEGANLEEARLEGAGLQGADMQKARGLKEDQVRRARIWVLAYLPEELLEKLSLPKDHNQRLRDLNLSGDHFDKLVGLDLRGAWFFFKNLQGANLKEARLEGAQFHNANLEKTHLEGANLTGAKGLTKEQIDSAIIDEKTMLPDYLKKADSDKPKHQ
jgi:uncharacterized protein YjbI with pentapeptide repeats